MPTDIRLTEDLRHEFTDRGDLMAVDGDDYVGQRASILSMLETRDSRGEPRTPENVENLRSNIERRLEDDPVLDTDVSVSVSQIRADSITFDVSLGNQELTIETA